MPCARAGSIQRAMRRTIWELTAELRRAAVLVEDPGDDVARAVADGADELQRRRALVEGAPVPERLDVDVDRCAELVLVEHESRLCSEQIDGRGGRGVCHDQHIGRLRDAVRTCGNSPDSIAAKTISGPF